MTAAALVPLAFLAIMTLVVVLAIRALGNAKREDPSDEAEYRWMSTDDYVPPPTSVAPPVSAPEPPPAAQVIRLPVRLHVVQGGRQ